MAIVHDHINRYEVESVASNRYSIGELLASMRSENQETEKIGPPIDFSFQDAHKMSEFVRSEPREGPHSYVTVSVELVDDQVNKSIVKPKSDTNPNEISKDEPIKKHVKYCSKAIRLSNNSLSNYLGFTTALNALVQEPKGLEWIDLSFNDLHTIDQDILQYTNLKVLYLHANIIEDIKQIDKLAALPDLKTLTLHGNLFDGELGYRQYVISTLPQLVYLDFSLITKSDRDKASTWKKLKIAKSFHTKKRKVSKKEPSVSI